VSLSKVRFLLIVFRVVYVCRPCSEDGPGDGDKSRTKFSVEKGIGSVKGRVKNMVVSRESTCTVVLRANIVIQGALLT
jgi:hypothetical protein